MMILALESSAAAASVALCRDEALVAQAFQNTGLTHSQTLLPMVEALLQNAGFSLSAVEVIAVAAGPGSFTGLRIGVSTAKGLAWPHETPCAGVSTLEAMAWNLAHMEGAELCAVMDARRQQVYHARFAAQSGAPRRLTDDRALSLDALEGELRAARMPQILIGDGALLCYNRFKALGLPVTLAAPHLRAQSAWGVARAALEAARQGGLCPGAQLEPIYHRLSQAERERRAREETNT